MESFADKTVYQIYPKSFQDTTGDGHGDLCGIIKHLDYLANLGVDYLWLTPFFVSPQADGGYDIADYRAIDPAHGTMSDFEELTAQARERGMGIMLDMVLCHTSTAHEWFQRALDGDLRYQRYYILRDGRGSTGPGDPGEPPTNWQCAFGGSMWEWEPRLGKWYLHMHDVSQPDLDWTNPEVRRECADVVRFWRDRGVSGFRFDVVSLISKPEVFEDSLGSGRADIADGPHVHEYLQELVREAGIEGMLTVGEMAASTLDNCIRYTRPENRELGMTFNFHHLKVDYRDGDKWSLMAPDIARLQELFATWQEGMQAGGGWNALFWDNHDQPRALSRFADDGELRAPSAKMLALVGDLMRGTPYVYQGDELGMTNSHFTTINDYRDVESLNYERILREERGLSAAEALAVVNERSRDNGRLPMQWDASRHAGFTAGEPWLPQAKDAPGCDQVQIVAAAEVDDPDSIFSFYRELMRLRHELPVIATGKIKFLDADAVPVIGYARFGELPVGESWDAATATDADMLAPGSLLVVGNFSDAEEPLGEDVCRLLDAGGWDVLLSAYGDYAGTRTLRPYEGVVFRRA